MRACLLRAGHPNVQILLVVLFGLVLRGYHYLSDPVVWHDEAALLVNVLDKDFVELLGPLRFHEAAPPLFLWLEKAVSLTLGDSTLALRLPIFLASCAALILMVPIALRLLPFTAACWTLLLFSCSEQLLWHTIEAKSYAFDVLAAVLVLALLCLGTRWSLVWRLLAAALLAPLLIWLSYPACFLCGGLLVALLPAVWRERRWPSALAYLLLAGMVGGAFLALVLGPVRAQHDPTIQECWTHCFADWHHPLRVLPWSLISTLEVGRYCCKPLGQGMILLAVGGSVLFWRQRRRSILALLLVPVGLALVASWLHRYPYGGVRVMVFATPAVLLLGCAAIPPVLDWLTMRHRILAWTLAGVLLLPMAVAVRRTVVPWDRADPASAAAWVQQQRGVEDPVLGNDGTHVYYFRPIGTAFHWWGYVPLPREDRLWVVYTDNESNAESRFQSACRALPHWRPEQRFESAHTTVVLLVKPQG
jgi:hypothetical protein